MKSNKNIYKRYLECPECGKINELWAKKGYTRGEGHIKSMYCYFCGKYVDMVEKREWNIGDHGF